MRLIELDASFRRYSATGLGKAEGFADAQGVLFECPMPDHSHMILLWFADRGVPAEAEPVARWQASGTGLDDLTLHPSVNAQVRDPTCWHGWVTNGEIK